MCRSEDSPKIEIYKGLDVRPQELRVVERQRDNQTPKDSDLLQPLRILRLRDFIIIRDNVGYKDRETGLTSPLTFITGLQNPVN